MQIYPIKSDLSNYFDYDSDDDVDLYNQNYRSNSNNYDSDDDLEN